MASVDRRHHLRRGRPAGRRPRAGERRRTAPCSCRRHASGASTGAVSSCRNQADWPPGSPWSQSNGSWRIDRAPDGVLAVVVGCTAVVSRRRRLLLEQDRHHAGARPDPAAELAARCRDGTGLGAVDRPEQWLAPAAHIALPVHTTLIGNVPVNDRRRRRREPQCIGAAGLGQASCSAFAAQLVWTLRQISDVTAVRLLAEGAPLTCPACRCASRSTRWQRYDPSAPPSSHDVLYVSHGHLAATGGDVTALAAATPGTSSPSPGPATATRLPSCSGFRRAMRLLTGKYGQRLKLRLSACSITPPTFDATGDILTVASGPAGRRVIAVTPTGAVRRIAADASLTAQPVTRAQHLS